MWGICCEIHTECMNTLAVYKTINKTCPCLCYYMVIRKTMPTFNPCIHYNLPKHQISCHSRWWLQCQVSAMPSRQRSVTHTMNIVSTISVRLRSTTKWSCPAKCDPHTGMPIFHLLTHDTPSLSVDLGLQHSFFVRKLRYTGLEHYLKCPAAAHLSTW